MANRMFNMVGDRMACYHHPSQQSVARCKICAKPVCKDCCDMYGVVSGPYAGEVLCYECTCNLIANNADEINKQRKKAKREWMIISIGAIIGALIGIIAGANTYGLGALGGFWIGLGFGGNLWIALRHTFSATAAGGEYGCVFGIVVFIFWYFVGGMGGPIVPLVRFFRQRKREEKFQEIITSETRVLQEMRDYYAYTQAMEENKGVDLATLASQGSELYNNTYAQNVLSKGKEAAQAELRQGVVQIAANGEIIRSFDKPARRNHAA